MIDIQAVKAGDLVEVETPFGREVGTYKGTINIRKDYHEVWVNLNYQSARLVHKSKFINHLPRPIDSSV